jgi:hypothetical protein
VGGQVGPNLTDDPIAGHEDRLSAFLQQPPPQMSFVKHLHLTKQQIADLSAFTRSSLKPGK